MIEKYLFGIEKIIYQNAGGGEAGEKAVMERRNYMELHSLFLSREYKEIAKSKWHPKNEKSTVNGECLQDNYD